MMQTDNYLPSYMRLPQNVTEYSARDSVMQLLEAIVATDFGQAKAVLPNFKPSLQEHTLAERLEKWGLIAKDNLVNPNHFLANVRHPVTQWAHTGHLLYRVAETDYWVMQHYWFKHFVCADIVAANDHGIFLGKGSIPYK